MWAPHNEPRITVFHAHPSKSCGRSCRLCSKPIPIFCHLFSFQPLHKIHHHSFLLIKFNSSLEGAVVDSFGQLRLL
ncbi:hypothetical protein VNO77_32898 [Canavalia gladiata]|uniref:Uncharacterized protein n=1 Tax=Canavalia gladiata TaxID=3824 RepID=A0AAN9KDY9_CANGL